MDTHHEFIIRANHGHDTNGNPRRLYVLYIGASVRRIWSEGYKGYCAVDALYQDMAQAAPMVGVTPAQYKLYKDFMRSEWNK